MPTEGGGAIEHRDLALSKTIAADVAPFGITVNTVGTGLIDTESAIHWFTARAGSGHHARTAPGQFPPLHSARPKGSVEEMAAVCLFLCSERASYTTGDIVMCDGGIFNTTG